MNQSTSKLFTDIIDSYRLAVFNRLEAIKDIGYLAGGTALSLQIRHRLSYDFDIFTTKKITPGLREQIAGLFDSPLRFTMDTSDQLTWFDQMITSPSLPLSAIDDIASDKAFTIGRRGV